MSRPNITSERLVSLFLLGVLLFQMPLLSIFDVPEYVLGIPRLYLYLFVAWAILIVLTMLTIESAAAVGETEEPGEEPPREEGRT